MTVLMICFISIVFFIAFCVAIGVSVYGQSQGLSVEEQQDLLKTIGDGAGAIGCLLVMLPFVLFGGFLCFAMLFACLN